MGHLVTLLAKKIPFALSFDGVDDRINFASVISQITKAGTYTIEFWFKCRNVTPEQVLFDNVINANDRNGIAISGGTLRFSYFDGAVYTGKSTGSLLSNDTWYHVACVNNAGVLTLYLNGVNQGSTSTVPHLGATVGLEMGSNTSNNWPFLGLMDEVRTWSTVRSQAQIQANMYTEFIGTEAGLVGYWKFKEGSGATTRDNTSNANTGTISGAAWVYGGVV